MEAGAGLDSARDAPRRKRQTQTQCRGDKPSAHAPPAQRTCTSRDSEMAWGNTYATKTGSRGAAQDAWLAHGHGGELAALRRELQERQEHERLHESMFLDLLREHRELQAQHQALQQQQQAQAQAGQAAAGAAQQSPSSPSPSSDAASSGSESRAATAAVRRLQRQLAAVQAELVATQQRETASLAQFCCVALQRESLLTAQLLALSQRLSLQEQQRQGELQAALQAAKLQWGRERQQVEEGKAAVVEGAAATASAPPLWEPLLSGQMGGDTAGLAAGEAAVGPAACSAGAAGEGAGAAAAAAAEPVAQQMEEGGGGSPATGPNTPPCAAGSTLAAPPGAATTAAASGAAALAASLPAAAGSRTATHTSHAAVSEQGPAWCQPGEQLALPAVPGGWPCQCRQAASGEGAQAGGQPGDWMVPLQVVPGAADPELFSVADLLL